MHIFFLWRYKRIRLITREYGILKSVIATSWTHSEVFVLIQLWGEEGIQEQLEGSKRNKHVYARFSSELAKRRITKSGEQCKVKKLHQEYKKIKI